MLVVENVEGGAGEKVIVPIELDTNPGFVSMSLSVTYDTSALTLISCEYTEVISGSVHSANYISPYVLTWENDTLTSNITSTGTIVYLTFLVSEDAKEQDYSIIVRIPTDGILDANGNTVSASSAMGTITVSAEHECSFGDWEYYSKTKHVRYCDEDDCDEKEYKNHNWNDGEIIEEPSHDEEGEIKYTCEDCEYSYTTEIDPEGHDWGDWTKLNDTHHKRSCSCGGEETETHNWNASVVTKEPTATEAGIRTYACKDCSATKTESIDPDTIVVTGVSLNKTSGTLKIGDSLSLTANVTPSNASNKNVTWSSSNSYVASVVNGVVTANRAGTATITVTTEDGGFVATCIITVEADQQPDDDNIPVTSIQLDKTSMTLALGISVRLKATIAPGDATNQNIVWNSSNPSVASVSNGLVTANKVGTAIITATTEDGGFVATCTVTVKGDDNVPVTGIALDKNDVELMVNSSNGAVLTPTVFPENATNVELIWSNSNPSVVDLAFFESGKALLVGLSVGTATITATTVDGGFVASCVVTVKKDNSVEYSKGLEFTSNGNGTCYVSGIGTCTDTEIVIPSIYNGMSVVAIDRDAFSGNAKITGVVIPDTVTKIDGYAFDDCTVLTEITIPGSVKEIGSRAFSGCTNLNKAVFMDGVTYVGLFMFESCSNLKEVILPNTITEIKKGAFRWCSGLTKITLSSNLTTIGELAFQSCRKLTSISLPNGLQTIDEVAFLDCNGLTSIDVPSSVTSIGEGAFRECDNLRAINIDNAYYRSIDGVLYNKDVTKLLCCPSGKSGSVVIPDGVTELGNEVFYYGKVTQITIPKSLVRVGDYAFFQCLSLTDVYYYGTEAQWGLIENIDDTFDDRPAYAVTIHYLGEDDPTPPVPTTTATIVVDSKEVMSGETIKVNINLADNPGLASLVLKVSYDKSLLTLTNVEYNTSMGGQTVPPASLTSPLTLYWVNGFANYNGNGVFATLTFVVSDAAKEGDNTNINVTYNADDVFNINDENVNLSITAGKVTVIDYVPGDINGDGVLNNKDVTRFMQYNAGWDVEVNTAALDVNGDGSVNNKDVTRLMQYNAGWDVEIH